MNILIIGGTGFIGSHVTRMLIEMGHNLALVHRGTVEAGLAGGVRHIRGSRDVLADLQPELARFAPSVVLDVIAYTERQAKELTNVCRGVADRVVVLSSADVYRNYNGFRGRATGPPDPVPLSESAPLRETLFPYRGADSAFEWADDYEKILVERTVLSDPELRATILRLPAVYGPGDTQHRIGVYLDRIDDGPRILMTAEQSRWRWTRGYVENVAAAIVLSIVDERAAGRIYNVGEAATPTEREWFEEIGSAIDSDIEIIETRLQDLPRTLRVPFNFRYWLMTDTTRIRAELGHEDPIGREEGLRRTIEWERGRTSSRR